MNQKALMSPLRFILLVISILASFSSNVFAQGNCNNIGFEDSTFTGWAGYYGNWSSSPVEGCCVVQTGDPVSPQVGLPAPPPPGFTEYRHTITSGTGVDPNVPQIPLVSPFGGAHSVLLNDYSTGGHSAKLSRTFEVSADAPLFTYQFAVVFQDPNHAQWEQPKFIVRVTDLNGQYLVGGYYRVAAAANVPGFQNGACCNIKYRNWSQVALDLTDYIGQTINISFEASDCAQTGHYGYAYADAVCGAIEISCNYCYGDTSAVAKAPEGYLSYLWNTGETSSSINVSQPVPGDSVTVTCQPYHPNKPATILKYYFPTGPNFANFNVSASCNTTTATFQDSTIINDISTQATLWKWTVNGDIISNQEQFVYDFEENGTYDVVMTVEDGKGCVATANKQVTIQPMQVEAVQTVIEQYNGYGVSCLGANDGEVKVATSNAVLPINYAWNIPAANTESVQNLGAGAYSVTVTDNTGCSISKSMQLVAPTQLNTTATIEKYACYNVHDGEISVSANGGVAPFAYTWQHNAQLNNNVATGLAAGDYFYTVTDANGCEKSGAENIVELPRISFNEVTYNLSCYNSNDGFVGIDQVSASGSYTLTWNGYPQITTPYMLNLAPGAYTFSIVDESECEVTDTIVITSPTEITASAMVVNPMCHNENNGSIALNVSGGSGGIYIYSWQHAVQNSNNVSNLSAGNYACTITDHNGCKAYFQTSLVSPQAITSSPTVENVSCYGGTNGSINLHASGGTGTFITVWPHNGQLNSDVAQNLSAGTYSVTITDENNCTATATTNVTQPAEDYSNITAAVIDASTYAGCDGSVALDAVTGNTAPYTYVWSTTPAQTSANVQQLCAGTYTVTVSDQNGCTTTAAFTVAEPLETGIIQANALSAVSLWPNPYQNDVSLTNVPQGTYSIVVTNALGQQVMALNKVQPNAAGLLPIDIQTLAKGVYYIGLQQGKQQISLRAVKQ